MYGNRHTFPRPTATPIIVSTVVSREVKAGREVTPLRRIGWPEPRPGGWHGDRTGD